MSKYDAKSIVHLNDREAMRQKGAQYIGGFDQNGLNQTILEVISNAIDEYLNGFGKQVKVIISKENEITISDNGRGIPVGTNKEGIEAFETALTKLHTSGKYLSNGSTGYNVSGGTHGIGLKAAVYLSKKCTAISNFQGNSYILNFIDGIKVDELRNLGKTKETGTTISFIPDFDIFEEAKIDTQYIIEQIKNLSYLSKGLQFYIEDQRTDLKTEIISKNGLLDYINDLNKDLKVLNKPFYFNVKNKDINCEVELALQYNNSSNTEIKLFTNAIPNKSGTHWTGFSTAFTRNINTYGRENNIIKSKDDNLTGNDLQDGLTLIINVKIPEPTFSSQTKENLSDKRGRTVVEKAVNEELKIWLSKNKKEAKAIIEKMLLSQRADKAAKKMKDVTDGIKNSKSKLALKAKVDAEKFSDCKSKDIRYNELAICEGISAKGTLVNGRDPETQAVLGIRGKILNTEKVEDWNKILNEKGTIKDIVYCVGTGIGKDFDIKKLRYGKIIFSADSDIDKSTVYVKTL